MSVWMEFHSEPMTLCTDRSGGVEVTCIICKQTDPKI